MIVQLGFPADTQRKLIEVAEQKNQSVEVYIEKLVIDWMQGMDDTKEYDAWRKEIESRKQIIIGKAPIFNPHLKILTLDVEESEEEVHLYEIGLN